jgi:hypothetical protein
MLDFRGALKRSSQQFKEILQADILDKLHGEFEIVEGVTVEKMARLLDVLGGVDVWHVDHENGMRGIALRIQTTSKNWHTFTIRNKRDSGAKTEYEKRKNAINNNYIYPYLTIQAYINNENRPVSWAVARTADIIKMIDGGHCNTKHTGLNQIGQAEFYVVDWYDMKIWL